MKSAKIKKIIATLLATSMTLGLVACGSGEGSKVEEKPSTETKENVKTDETGVTFPLEEEVTFNLMVVSNGQDMEAQLEKCEWWQDLYEQTNVKIELTVLPAENTMTTLNAMFMTGDEGDAIVARFIKDNELSELTKNGLLLPLNEYVDDAELMPNFNERILAESPGTKGVITSPDGKIYAMPEYNALQGSYLESPMWINKAWLDQLDLEIPNSLETLEAALAAFRDNDMNGNGKKDDEIPFLIQNGNSSSHFEAFMGLYGIPTKDGTYENYVFLEDGKVVFAPQTEEFKDAIVQLNDWYEKGLIWEEAFTATNETFVAKTNGTECVVGLVQAKNPPLSNPADYVQLEPFAVDGYETKWYVHPGIMGVKTRFCVTRSCENADILMAWLDQFYAIENTIRTMYGEEEDGRYSVKDGKYVLNTMTADQTAALSEKAPTLGEILILIPKAYTAIDYAEKMVMNDTQKQQQESYELYEPYLNDEVWPRPYLSDKVTTRLAELRTDIFNTVSQKKAAWITGASDINADWEEFNKSLEKMGIDEFVSLMQESYDVYMEAQK